MCEPCDAPDGLGVAHGLQCTCGRQRFGLEQSLAEVEFMRSACSAAQAGDARRLEQLLDSSVQQLSSDGAGNGTGYTPLHYAARGGHAECVSLLLRHRAHVDARTSGGATPLHRAAFTGQTEVCKALLRARADASLQDSDGETALHKAAAQQHGPTARALLAVRALPTRARRWQKTLASRPCTDGQRGRDAAALPAPRARAA